MLTINYLTKASTHCAGTIYACQRGLFSIPSVLPELFGKFFTTFFAKKRNLFLPLLRTLHLIINLANDFKQKVSLATYGCLFRKGKLRFVSEMWSSTLQVAFLFNNIVK